MATSEVAQLVKWPNGCNTILRLCIHLRTWYSAVWYTVNWFTHALPVALVKVRLQYLVHNSCLRIRVTCEGHTDSTQSCWPGRSPCRVDELAACSQDPASQRSLIWQPRRAHAATDGSTMQQRSAACDSPAAVTAPSRRIRAGPA